MAYQEKERMVGAGGEGKRKSTKKEFNEVL